MGCSQRFRRALAACAVMLAAGVISGSRSNLALAQPPRPRPQPRPGSQVPSLKPPLRLVSVSLNGGAQKLFDRNLIDRPGSPPTPTPEYLLPNNPLGANSFMFEFRTSDGRGTIEFSHTLPAGVQANAFQWEQSSGSPPAIGRLRYNFCNACPASFTLEVIAKDRLDFSGAAPKANVKINLTPFRGPARILTISRVGTGAVRPRFEITFTPGTFAQEGGQIFATYPGGLKYRLIPENLTVGTMSVVIERLKVGRNVEVRMSNPLGGSSRAVELPAQFEEHMSFECINGCSTCWSCGSVDAIPFGDTASVSHNQLSPFSMGSTDTIKLKTVRSDPPECDEEDHIFTNARVAILNPVGAVNPPGGPGTVRITRPPPTNALLRAPDNKIKVKWWKPGLVGEWWYQVVPNGVRIVGVCPNRIVH